MRFSPRPLATLAACLGLSILAPTATAVAQPKAAPKVDEARARYDRGKQLYEEGAFDAALIEFQRAYELAPSYKILYNIGQVHRQRNDYASALRAFERYLKEGGAEIDAKRKADIDREIAQLRVRVATLQISTNVPGVEISIDDESVGKTPLPQGVLVNSGKRRVTASKEGRVPVTKVINVAGADTQKIDIELLEPTGSGAAPTATAAPTAAPSSTATGAPSSAPSSTASVTPEKAATPWVAWTITGLLGAGAAVTGVLALGAASDLKDKRDKPGATRSALDDASSSTKTLALVSDLLWVGTAVAGGVSIYLTVREPPKDSGKTVGPVRLGIAPGALNLSGSFLIAMAGLFAPEQP